MKQWLCDRWGIAVAAGILLLIIMPFIDYYGLWFDEVFSVVMSRSIDSIVNMVSTQENNMLLHYLFLWLWQPWGDGSEFYLRISSVILVIFSLFPLHAAVKKLANGTAANVAVLLYVSHMLVLEHARTCRGYSLALLLSAVVFWLWVSAMHRGRLRDGLLLGAVAGLAVWTHYFSALVLPVLLFAMLWRDGMTQPWRWICGAVCMFVFFALPIFLTRPPDGAAQISWANVPNAQSIRSTLWMLSGSSGVYQELAIKIMLVSIVAAGIFKWRKAAAQHRNIFVGMAVGFVLVVLAVLLESFIAQPVFVYRFFTPLVPVYCAVMAFALCGIWRWWRVIVLVFVLVMAAYESWRVYAVDAMPSRFWWKPLANQLAWQLQADDVILVYPGFLRLPVDYYLDVIDGNRSMPRPQDYTSAPYRAGGGIEPVPDWAHLQTVARTAPRVWIVADEQQKPSDIRLQRTQLPAIRKMLLQEDRILAYDWHYGDRSLQRYDMVQSNSPSAATNVQR